MRPLARALFPARVGAGDAREFFAFTVRYRAGGDVALREHRDASVATLNLNLNAPGEEYGGSTLYFVEPPDGGGGSDGEGGGARRHTVAFAPGDALLHLGALRHAARPVEHDAAAIARVAEDTSTHRPHLCKKILCAAVG